MGASQQLAGRQRSLGVYYDGQNANGAPDHFISLADASKLKSKGAARSIHRGTAILIKGHRPPLESRRESVQSGWIVVGQTKKNSPPGRPHYGFPWSKR